MPNSQGKRALEIQVIPASYILSLKYIQNITLIPQSKSLWVVNLFLKSQATDECMPWDSRECQTILHQSTSGCFDLIASQVFAQLKIPDLAIVQSILRNPLFPVFLKHFNLNQHQWPLEITLETLALLLLPASYNPVTILWN